MNPYYEEIVVGSSLRALLFASEREIPIFFTEPEKPFEFELFMPSVDLSSMRLHNGPLHWRTVKDNVITGGSKIALWEHLLFILGLKGLVPFSNLCSSLRFDDNILTGHSDYAKLRSINFGVCYYFDEHATYNLLACEDNPRIYHTYDRLAFIRGGKHHLDLIQSEELFCNKVWFYPTPRIDGKSSIKDACAFSILSEEQIDDFDFSETMARLVVLQKMKDLGLKGPRNGYQYNGSIRYRSFKVEALNRYKFLSSPPVWLEADSIKVPQISEEELISRLPKIVEINKKIIEPLWRNT